MPTPDLRVETRNGNRLVVSHSAIGAGTTILRLDGRKQDHPSADSVQIGLKCHLIADNEHSIWPQLTHSCNPNTELLGRMLRTRRPITAGEELTIDYNTTEWQLCRPFVCHCAAHEQPRRIAGYAALSTEERAHLAGRAAPHLLFDACRITQINRQGAGVAINIANSPTSLTVGIRWLADHDESSAGLNPVTQQRRTDPAAPFTKSLIDAQVAEEGRVLEIIWSDGHKTRCSAKTLSEAANTSLAPPNPPQAWEAKLFAEGLPEVAFQDVLESENGVQSWLATLQRWGFCLVTDAPPTPEATERLVRALGYPRQTIFGDMWTFGANGAHQDTAYSAEHLPLHSDGTYSLDPPGWQVLHCLQFEGQGGMSLLSDGLAAAEAIRTNDPDAFDALVSIPVPARYLGDGVDLRAAHPVIRCDDAGKIDSITFNAVDRAPLWLPQSEMTRFYKAWAAFSAQINQDRAVLRFRLEPGRVLIFNNRRLLHGRESFTGTRIVTGAYLNREDVDSRWRTVCDALATA